MALIRPIHRVGVGTDLHRLEPGRKLILGHVPNDFEKGPVGHSDGDVVIHALIDALCGAAGLPDIGELFPDSDPAYRGIDSSRLLDEVLSLLEGQRLAVVNIDVVVHIERPRLGENKQKIRRELARLLSLPTQAVSVKAKTNEGMDATGRGEAIAAHAVAVLVIGEDA